MPESKPIFYLDHSEVRAGKIGELKKAVGELVQFVEANEPRLIAYNVYFTEDGKRMTVLVVHRDSASLEFHMKVAGPVFPKFAELIKLLRIDVYGRPSDDLMEQLRTKARLLGEGTVVVHDVQAGFARFAIRPAAG